jgi:SPP1 gp7 family putative phage head morphogenesis protein
MLRSAHKNWFYKNKLYTFDAIRHERQSVGIPVIYMPAGSQEDNIIAAKKIVQNIRSTERTGIVMPGPKTDGWLFEFADIKSSQSTNLYESINHHNREISKNILAQFLELGNTESGSRALDESQQNLFLLSLTSVAKQISEVVSRYLIPLLIDLNFDNVTEYPKLSFKGVGAVDFAKLSTALSTLAGGGLLTPDEDLEAYIRTTMNLPAKMAVEETAVDPAIEGDPEETSPEDEAAQGEELDSLTSELEDLAGDDEEGSFSELAEITFNEFDLYLDNAAEFVAKGGHLDEETKKKISEALKKKGGSELTTEKKSVESRIEDTRDNIARTQDDYREKIGQLRGQISELRTLKDSVAKGKAGSAQRKEVAAKARALLKQIEGLRTERDSGLNPLKQLRTADLKNRKAVNAEIRARKKAISEMVKSIRSDLTNQKGSVQESIKPLRQQVKDNSAQVQELRKAIAALPKDSDQRAHLKAMIEGIQEESKGIRSQTDKIREDFSGVKEKTKAAIDKTKKDSGLYHEHPSEVGIFDDDFMAISRRVNNRFILDLQNETRTGEDLARLKKKGFRFNEYEDLSPRPMTFAERKVNFTSLNRSLDTFESILKEKLEEITARQREDLLKQIKTAVESNDIQAVGQIKAKYTGELSQALSDVQKELFEIGKQSAAREMTVVVPGTKSEVRGAMRVQNDALIDGYVNDLETSAKTSVTQVVNKKAGLISETGKGEAVAAAAEGIDKVIKKNLAALETLNTTGAVNLGRASVFERFPEKVYAMQYSAILDSQTTDLCRSLDGRVVAPGSREFYSYTPPQHYHCRSIWVEILTDETFKPKLTGIPASIPANATIDTAKELQAPIILKDSPARKVIEQELAERKEKLATLQDSGKFKNRQDDHSKRIAELEKSLSDADKGNQTSFSEYCKAILTADGIKF